MAAAVESSDQFLCSVCLEVFTDPVSTPCGHNFCKSCLTQAWDSAPCRCPLCKKSFDTRPELSVNTFIKEMVSQFRRERRSNSMGRLANFAEDSSPASVLCDVCPDPKLKALKSCLVCLTSFCETHLQPHLTVSGLKRHQLMEPVEDLEDRTCPKHQKPLELFCRSDHTCICTMCPLLEHKNHKFVSLEEEAQLKRSSMQQTQAQTQLMVQQRRMKIQEIGHSLEVSQEAVDTERTSGLQAFSNMEEALQKRKEKFIEELEEKHKQTQKQAQELISELQQEICELEKNSSELEQLSKTEDHLHLIQRHTSWRTAADRKDSKDMRDWRLVRFKPQNYEGSADTALVELEESLNEEFKKLFQAELHGLRQFAVDLTLDPDTAHPHLVLSEDLKEVYYSVEKHPPDNPRRFNIYWCVLGKQSFCSGRFYFEVQVLGKTRWWIGVAQESVPRKACFTQSPQNGVWIIGLSEGDQYWAMTDPRVPLYPPCPPQKVGVFVDYSEGIVCFYDADTEDLIYSFTDCRFRGKVLPLLNPEYNEEGTNSAPLILTDIE